MDDKKTYTYGYNIGWNVENEYLEEQKSILEKYNEQKKIVDDWGSEIGRIRLSINRNREDSTEDKLREQYESDQIRMPFSDYVNEYRRFVDRKENELNIDYDGAIDNYNANLYYLIEIKNQTRRSIIDRRNELDLRLKQLNIREEQIGLIARPRYDENHKVVNSEELRNFRVELDNISLERKKLEHALEETEKYRETIEFTEEENKLMLRGLNPRQRDIYNDIDKSSLETSGIVDVSGDNFIDKTDENGIGEPSGDDPTDKTDENGIGESSGDNPTDKIDDAIAQYEEALARYEDLLSEYNQELKQLYQLQHQYENDEIDYKQYLEFGKHILERYDFIEEEYQKLLKLKSEIEASCSLENEELNKKLKDLEQQLDDWRYYATHLGNGMDPVTFDELENKIKKIKEKLNRRNNLKDPTPPQKPGLIDQKTKDPIPSQSPITESKGKNEILEELVTRIGYGKSDEEDYLYGPWDNFVYKHKDIKIWNLPKTKSRTFLDKPLKLVKSTIGSVVFGIQKLFSEKAYKSDEDLRKRIDKLQERVNNLTDEEIEFLSLNLTYGKFKELCKATPDIVFNAIRDKIRKTYNGEYVLNANLKIEKMYVNIIGKYRRCLDIKEQLKNPDLSLSERTNLEDEFNMYSKELCTDINRLQSFKAEVDQRVNLSGAAALDYNYRARFNQSAGGFNVSKKVLQEYSLFWKHTNISEFLNKGDGFNAAKRFLYGEKLKVSNTEEKRTLKNRFGKARVGAYEFSPFITVADYSEDTYLKDVLSTIMIISSISNIAYMKNLKDELANTKAALNQANAQIQAYNININATNKSLQELQQKIAELTNKQNVAQGQINQIAQDISNVNQTIMSNNKTLQDLQNIFSLYNKDPEAFVNQMIEFTRKTVGTDHGYSEYFTMTADAGQKGTGMLMSNGSIYNSVDQLNHNFSADLISKLEGIQGNTTLSAAEKAKQIALIFNDSSDNLSSLIGTFQNQVLDYISNYGSSWDLSSFEAVMNSVSTYDPTFVSDVFNGFIEAAMKVDSLQTIQTLTPVLNLPTIDLTVPNALQTIQNIALDLPAVSLAPAIATCASIVGKETCDTVVENIRKGTQTRKTKGDTLEGTTEDMTDRLAKMIDEAPMDMDKVAKENYKAVKAEWDSKGPFYKLFHQKEKPRNLDYYIDALKEENNKGGYSL